jgi:hypothetical protein
MIGGADCNTNVERARGFRESERGTRQWSGGTALKLIITRMEDRVLPHRGLVSRCGKLKADRSDAALRQPLDVRLQRH